MHILVLGINYAPEATGIGRLTTGLCEFVARAGHQVSVVTGMPHYPEWRFSRGYEKRWYARETLGQVELRRVRCYLPRRQRSWERILYDTSFSLAAGLVAIGIRKVDLILCVSPPLQLGVVGYVLARLKGAPWVLEIQDIVPDVAIALGMLRNHSAIFLAKKLEDFVYLRAKRILVISEGFAVNLHGKGVPAEKVRQLPNWVDTERIRPGARVNQFRVEQGLSPEAFVLLYSGNVGFKQGLDKLVGVAERLRNRNDIQFVIVGDGSQKAALERDAAGKRLTNLHLAPLQPEERFNEMLAAADCFFLAQQPTVFEHVIPSKLMVYMAAGRPVIAAVPVGSETALCLQGAGCGYLVPPGDEDGIVKVVLSLAANRSRAAELGEIARRHAEQHYAKEKVLSEYLRTLQSLLTDEDLGQQPQVVSG